MLVDIHQVAILWWTTHGLPFSSNTIASLGKVFFTGSGPSCAFPEDEVWASSFCSGGDSSMLGLEGEFASAIHDTDLWPGNTTH